MLTKFSPFYFSCAKNQLMIQHTTINYTGLKDLFSRICKNVLNQRRVVACSRVGQVINCFNDTHRKKLVFRSIQYRNGWLVASDLFDMFTQSIKFYTFHYQCRCLKNVIHQIDSKNGQVTWLLSASFTAKVAWVFVLTLKNAFSQMFHF